MNIQVGMPLELKNRNTGTVVQTTVEALQGNEITFKSADGNTFSINSRTLADSYELRGTNSAVPATTTTAEQAVRPMTDLVTAAVQGGRAPTNDVELTIPGDLEAYKNNRVREITRNINRNQSREENANRIRQDLANLANELRGQGYPQDAATAVANTQFIVPLNPPRLSLGTLFNNSFNPETEMNGSKYMHSFLTKDYLLNEFSNIEEVKNFINVIAMNKSGVLLKEFKENRDALRNIILGLIRVSYSIDVLNIEYEYEYNIVFKEQLLDHVVFDFDQYQMNKIVAVIKTHGEGDQAQDVLIQLTEKELKRSNIVRLEKVRSTDEMGIDEVPAPIRIEFGAGLNYQEEGLKFGKAYLSVIVADEELADKLIKFINGALLLYPDLMEEIPNNITLVEEDFSVFKYREMIAKANDPIQEGEVGSETNPAIIDGFEVEATEDGEVKEIDDVADEDEDMQQLVEDEKLAKAIQTSHDIQEEMQTVRDQDMELIPGVDEVESMSEEIEVENELELEKTAQ